MSDKIYSQQWLPLPKGHLHATYNKSSHLRIFRESSSWIWGGTLIQYKTLLKQCGREHNVLSLSYLQVTASEGKMNFSQWSVPLGVSIQGKPHAQPVVGQRKTHTNAVSFFVSFLLCLFFWGGGAGECTCFVSFSLTFSLFLGWFSLWMMVWLFFMYLSFWWERKEEKKEWSGVCKKREGSWNSREGIELILIQCFSLHCLKRNN